MWSHLRESTCSSTCNSNNSAASSSSPTNSTDKDDKDNKDNENNNNKSCYNGILLEIKNVKTEDVDDLLLQQSLPLYSEITTTTRMRSRSDNDVVQQLCTQVESVPVQLVVSQCECTQGDEDCHHIDIVANDTNMKDEGILLSQQSRQQIIISKNEISGAQTTRSTCTTQSNDNFKNFEFQNNDYDDAGNINTNDTCTTVTINKDKYIAINANDDNDNYEKMGMSTKSQSEGTTAPTFTSTLHNNQSAKKVEKVDREEKAVIVVEEREGKGEVSILVDKGETTESSSMQYMELQEHAHQIHCIAENEKRLEDESSSQTGLLDTSKRNNYSITSTMSNGHNNRKISGDQCHHKHCQQQIPLQQHTKYHDQELQQHHIQLPNHTFGNNNNDNHDDVMSNSDSTISTVPFICNHNTFPVQSNNKIHSDHNENMNNHNYNNDIDIEFSNKDTVLKTTCIPTQLTQQHNERLQRLDSNQKKEQTEKDETPAFTQIIQQQDTMSHLTEQDEAADDLITCEQNTTNNANDVFIEIHSHNHIIENNNHNTTNDNDISYDESINSSSLTHLKLHYEKMLSNQKAEHNQQIDDVLLQLSSIESTYQDEISTLQNNLAKKELMCDALTTSLSDYKKRYNELELELENCTIMCNELEYNYDNVSLQLQEARREKIALRQQLEALRTSFEIEKNEAVSFAQQEIQSQAETQFALAQKQYMQLKTDHQQNVSEKEILQGQLNLLTQQMENKERVHKSHTSQLQEELNVVRLELSSSRNENQKVKLMFNDRMSQLENSEKALEQKLEMKVKECQVLVKAKHDLRRENTDLQNLCEELMSMVEKGVDHVQSTEGSPSVASRSTRSTRSNGYH